MKIRFNWGTGIAIAMTIMVCGMLTLVYVAAREDFFLVENDYYKKGINYQEQIDRINNTNALTEKPQVVINGNNLNLKFPAWFESKQLEGEVLIYSPVNEALDQKVPLKLDEQLQQTVTLLQTKPGRYTVKVNWTAEGTAYYVEQNIIIE